MLVQNGDLVLSSRSWAMATGAQRITQDLTMALGEPYGDDRFHPQWGSVLPRYIGQNIAPELQMRVEAEAVRIVRNYIAAQQDTILSTAAAGQRSQYSTADVVRAIVGLDVQVQQDTIRLRIQLATQANQLITLNRTVEV